MGDEETYAGYCMVYWRIVGHCVWRDRKQGRSDVDGLQSSGACRAQIARRIAPGKGQKRKQQESKGPEPCEYLVVQTGRSPAGVDRQPVIVSR